MGFGPLWPDSKRYFDNVGFFTALKSNAFFEWCKILPLKSKKSSSEIKFICSSDFSLSWSITQDYAARTYRKLGFLNICKTESCIYEAHCKNQLRGFFEINITTKKLLWTNSPHCTFRNASWSGMEVSLSVCGFPMEAL